jgi:hypothetical protein
MSNKKNQESDTDGTLMASKQDRQSLKVYLQNKKDNRVTLNVNNLRHDHLSLIQDLDVDGDGTIEIGDLVYAMKDRQDLIGQNASQRSTIRKLFGVFGIILVILGIMAALMVIPFIAVDNAKDTEVTTAANNITGGFLSDRDSANMPLGTTHVLIQHYVSSKIPDIYLNELHKVELIGKGGSATFQIESVRRLVREGATCNSVVVLDTRVGSHLVFDGSDVYMPDSAAEYANFEMGSHNPNFPNMGYKVLNVDAVGFFDAIDDKLIDPISCPVQPTIQHSSSEADAWKPSNGTAIMMIGDYYFGNIWMYRWTSLETEHEEINVYERDDEAALVERTFAHSGHEDIAGGKSIESYYVINGTRSQCSIDFPCLDCQKSFNYDATVQGADKWTIDFGNAMSPNKFWSEKYIGELRSAIKQDTTLRPRWHSGLMEVDTFTKKPRSIQFENGERMMIKKWECYGGKCPLSLDDKHLENFRTKFDLPLPNDESARSLGRRLRSCTGNRCRCRHGIAAACGCGRGEYKCVRCTYGSKRADNTCPSPWESEE